MSVSNSLCGDGMEVSASELATVCVRFPSLQAWVLADSGMGFDDNTIFFIY